MAVFRPTIQPLPIHDSGGAGSIERIISDVPRGREGIDDEFPVVRDEAAGSVAGLTKPGFKRFTRCSSKRWMLGAIVSLRG
jgi:hypothetical protein